MLPGDRIRRVINGRRRSQRLPPLGEGDEPLRKDLFEALTAISRAQDRKRLREQTRRAGQLNVRGIGWIETLSQN